MRAVPIVTTVALLAITLPVATAQDDLPTQGRVVSGGCSDLEDCDPKKANDERLVLSTEGRPVRMVLFGHFQDMLQRAPINTQLPDAEEEPDIKGGFLMPTIYTEDPNAPCCKLAFNRFTMYSSPGFVEFLPGGKWRTHQEPGLAEEVRIVPIDGKYMYGYWYLSANSKPAAVAAGPEAGVMPAVGVYMKMSLGRHSSSNADDIVAEGDTGTGFQKEPDPMCVRSAPSACVTLLNTPAGQVYEFKVPMELRRTVLPSVWDTSVDEKKHGYVIEVVPYQLEQGDARLTQSDWTLRTGADFPPRIVLDVENAMVSKSTRIHTFDGHLFFRWSFTSPWGSYDVNTHAIELAVDGPKGFAADLIQLRYSPDHDGHFKPLNATWRYDYVNEPLPPGKYKISAMAHNYQDTYMLVWEEAFTVDARGVPEVEHLGPVGSPQATGKRADNGGASPGIGALGLVVVVGVAAAAAERAARHRQ